MYFGVEGCPEIFRRFCPNPAGGRGGKWEFHLPHFRRASPVVAACAQLATDPMCVRVKKIENSRWQKERSASVRHLAAGGQGPILH